ncbi:hypothetical protein QCA50_018894 [Cerrena zonata]|uniref:Uncharacterized protein n=1 Tax=Cerrena zonata TaxID=2478898 RepID=A0AAW0FC65_9APHY
MTGLRLKSGPRRVAPVAVPPPSLTHPSHSMPPHSGVICRGSPPPSPEEEDIVTPSHSPSPSEVSSPECTPSPGINTENGHKDLHDILVGCANTSRLVREAVLAEVELHLAHLALQTREMSQGTSSIFISYKIRTQPIATDTERLGPVPPVEMLIKVPTGLDTTNALSLPNLHVLHLATLRLVNTQLLMYPLRKLQVSELAMPIALTCRQLSHLHLPQSPHQLQLHQVPQLQAMTTNIDRDDGSRDERRHWYVIMKGRGKIGIFQHWYVKSWQTESRLMSVFRLSAALYCHKVPGAQYQSFSTWAEALHAFNAAERDRHTEFL